MIGQPRHAHLLDDCMTIRAHSRVFHSIGRDTDSSYYRWLRAAIRTTRDKGAPWSLLAHSAMMSPRTVKKIYSHE